MRVNDDHVTVNAAIQTQSGTPSVYHFWQSLLKLRRENVPTFIYGGFELVNKGHEHVFGYVRTAEDGEKWVTLLNFTGKETEWEVPGELKGGGGIKWVVGNYCHGTADAVLDGQKGLEVGGDGKDVVKLRPWEGVLGRLVGE